MRLSKKYTAIKYNVKKGVKALPFFGDRFVRVLDRLKDNFKFCYWITPAKFKNGLFDKEFFDKAVDIPFEGTHLLGSEEIKNYLSYRYGDYMKLPPEEARLSAVHAYIYDTQKDYKEYMR